jgi:hypothetical protein
VLSRRGPATRPTTWCEVRARVLKTNNVDHCARLDTLHGGRSGAAFGSGR